MAEQSHPNDSWLPTSHDLAAELPALVARLHQEGFEVFRVMYNLAEWPDTPRRVSIDGRTVRLGGFRYQPHNLLTVIDGSGCGRLSLRAVPA